jgi:hypothetical protein
VHRLILPCRSPFVTRGAQIRELGVIRPRA